MDDYHDTIRSLSFSEKLRLVERIWDDLATERSSIPLPEWAVAEALRRRDEMLADPKLGCRHEEVWRRIDDARIG